MRRLLLIIPLLVLPVFAQVNITKPFYVAGVLKPAAAGGGGSAIAIVQTNLFSGSTQYPVATAQSHAAGNSIYVGIWTGYGAVTVSSVTNTAGDTFTQCSGSRISVDQSIEWWRTDSSAGHASDKVGATLSVSRSVEMMVVEVTGQAASSPFETAATGSSLASTTVTSASFSPASSGNLTLCFAGMYNTTGGAWTAGSGYTLLISGTDYDSQVQSRLSTPSGSQTASITHATTDDNVISVVTIKD